MAPERHAGRGMPGWFRPYCTGVVSVLLVAGTILLLRPREEVVELLIATPTTGQMTVAISGEVSRPGVYRLPGGSRLIDLLEQAGGTLPGADPAVPSRALLLRDEIHVHIPPLTPITPAPPTALASPPLATAILTTVVTSSAPPATPIPVIAPPAAPTAATSPSAQPAATAAPTAAAGARLAASPTLVVGVPARAPAPAATRYSSPWPVNINTASAAELERLPGIGPVLAGRIIVERELHGRFERIEDLARVAGLTAETIARLRPLATV